MSATEFAAMGLCPAILSAVTKAGIITPTPIQQEAIPVALEGTDVIGVAQTGTGKTLAFVLPLIQKLQDPDEFALVLVPTRELALQVEESFNSIARKMQPQMRTTCLIGGAPLQPQAMQLRRGVRLVVATPGRLRDHLNRGTVSLGACRNLVLDEADRMLDMGFLPEIQRILSLLPKKRHTMLFSATFERRLMELANSYMQNPVRIEVAPPGSAAADIRQELCYVNQNDKPALLKKLLSRHTGPVLVFSRTKHGAKRLKTSLDREGFGAAEIHSDRSLSQRRAALDGFKSGAYRVLVATDLAARGIDVHSIELVVNYDLPDAAEDYVHRIGRTGRAGKLGHAISFATHEQHREVRQIERLVKLNLPLSSDSEAPARQPMRSNRPGNGNRSRRPSSGRGSYAHR